MRKHKNNKDKVEKSAYQLKDKADELKQTIIKSKEEDQER